MPSKPSLLFYHHRVYKATTLPDIENLPNPDGPVLIWSLFEANQEHLPECAYQAPILFPVQAPSPKPELHKSWRKKRNSFLSAFTLWTLEELKQG